MKNAISLLRAQVAMPGVRMRRVCTGTHVHRNTMHDHSGIVRRAESRPCLSAEPAVLVRLAQLCFEVGTRVVQIHQE